MAPVFAELSKKFTQLVFVKVDVDEVQVLILTVNQVMNECKLESETNSIDEVLSIFHFAPSE